MHTSDFELMTTRSSVDHELQRMELARLLAIGVIRVRTAQVKQADESSIDSEQSLAEGLEDS
jgi:hypothetical protein